MSIFFNNLNNFYSFKDCWNFVLYNFRDKNIFHLEIKNNVIALCDTSPEKFWTDFYILNITKKKYKIICENIFKYFYKDIPVPLILKKTRFNNLTFFVKKGVFIPQVDSELLLKLVVLFSLKRFSKQRIEKLRILDVGTGSGNIAISLAILKKSWRVVATDIDFLSLNIAKKNIVFHNVKNRVNVFYSNLFSNLSDKQKFDVIVSNPPYINISEYDNLSCLTKKQPFKALVPPNGDFSFLLNILDDSDKFVYNDTIFVIELNSLTSHLLFEFIEKSSRFSWEMELFNDYGGNVRAIVLSKKNKNNNYLKRFGSSVG